MFIGNIYIFLVDDPVGKANSIADFVCLAVRP